MGRFLSRYALSTGAAAALLAGCSGGLQLPTSPSAVNDATKADKKVFHYTGAAQTFVVPQGVTQVTIDARGAAGQGCYCVSGIFHRVLAAVSLRTCPWRRAKS